jgi:hypothetical protein
MGRRARRIAHVVQAEKRDEVQFLLWIFLGGPNPEPGVCSDPVLLLG